MPLISACVVAGTMTVAIVAGAAGTAGAATPGASACQFNGQSDTGLVTGITPGASVTVTCTGLPPKTTVLLVEASPLAALVPSAQDQDEADISALKSAKSTSTGTLPPGTKFTVPNPFKATDPNAVCPPTQAQVNTGLIGCAIAVAEFSGEDFGDALTQYTGQDTPQAPSLSLGSVSARAGDQVTISNGSGPGDWWGDATGPTTLSSSDITVGGITAGSTSASISAATYTEAGALTPENLSGTFTVPCGIVGSEPVKVTEPNGTPLAGTISATATLDVLPGTIPAVTSISPTHGSSAGGTSVTISGCNFADATGVSFGTKAAASFHVNSDTSITAVSPPGTGTVDVVVTGSGGHSASNSASEFSYGVQGYDLAGTDGGTFSFGDAKNFGSLPGLKVIPNKPIVGLAATTDGAGYWLVGADGGVFAFGNAVDYGSLPALKVTPNKPIVGIASETGGYWLVGADGGVFAFGDAVDYGSLPALKVTPVAPIVGIAATPDGKGYWLVGADGGVFAFGDAKDYGSLPALKVTPNKPVVGIAASALNGYWLVGADGGTYAFGSATNYGSLPGLKVTPNAPIVGVASPDSGGYWLVGSDGGVYSFGDAKFFGSMGGTTLNAPVSGINLA
jgi:hypothetical protein